MIHIAKDFMIPRFEEVCDIVIYLFRYGYHTRDESKDSTDHAKTPVMSPYTATNTIYSSSNTATMDFWNLEFT
jgi:hypothetical protein